MNNLHILRSLLNYTTQDMGDALGVTRQTISNWERGKYELPKAYKYAILYLLWHEWQNQYPDEIVTLLWKFANDL